MNEAAAVGVTVVFWASVSFVVTVSIVWAWWHAPLGRALVALDALLAVTVGPSAMNAMFGWPRVTDPFWRWVTIGALYLDGTVIMWRAWVLFRIQAGPEDQMLGNWQALAKLCSPLRKVSRGRRP